MDNVPLALPASPRTRLHHFAPYLVYWFQASVPKGEFMTPINRLLVSQLYDTLNLAWIRIR
jgi:hypothetical protein